MTLAIALVGLVLSIYGAFVSTYIAVLRSREMKRNIRIFIQHLDHRLPYCSVVIVNTSKRPIRLDLDQFELDDGNVAVASVIEDGPEPYKSETFPVELADGQDCKRWFHLDALARFDSAPARYVVYDVDRRRWAAPLPTAARRYVVERHIQIS